MEAPRKHRSASFLAAFTASMSFTRGPSLDSSVAPELRNSTQFSNRSLAKANTTRLNSFCVILSRWAASRKACFSISGVSMLSSKSAHTMSVVSAPASLAAFSSFATLAINVERPPQSTVLITLLPGQGRIHAGLSFLMSARMKSGSMLRPFFPSCRHTIWVRLATDPPPGYGFAGRYPVRNIQRANARW